MQQRKEREHENLKKAVFQECVDRYGGKSETELFQSFAFVQQQYLRSTKNISSFETELLHQINQIGR